MDAAIVELDALADAVGAAAQDDDLVARGGRRLAFRLAHPVALVGRIHVGGERGELGGAGVDALIDGMDAVEIAPARDLGFVDLAQLGDAGVGKSHLLQPVKPRLEFLGMGEDRQELVALAQQGLFRDDVADLLEEPGIVFAGGVDLRGREPVAIGLRDDEEPVGPRLRQLGADRVLVAGERAGDFDLVEAGEARLQRAQRLLHRFREGAADRHRLAHRLHRGREQRVGAGELLEGEARHLGDDVIDRRLERGGRDAGDLVAQFVERVSDRELRRDLGDGEARRLGGERRGARHARVHLDDEEAAVIGIDRELHVGAAGIDADLAQHRDRGVAHHLVFLVGQSERRRHRHAVAGMDAHRIEVLDRADDDAIVRAVADHLHLELLPPQHRFLDQHLVRRRDAQPAADDLLEFLLIVGDAAASAAQGEGGADDRRQPDKGERRLRLLERAHEPALGRGEADPVHRLAEELAVLGLGDRRRLGADELDPVPLERARMHQRHRRVERGLPAHGRQQRVGALGRDDALDEVGGDRLDIGRVGEAWVGHDRRRVRIDEDDAIALFLQGLHRLRARIIELARLPDHDRPRADDEDRANVRALRHGCSGKARNSCGFPVYFLA